MKTFEKTAQDVDGSGVADLLFIPISHSAVAKNIAMDRLRSMSRGQDCRDGAASATLDLKSGGTSGGACRFDTDPHSREEAT